MKIYRLMKLYSILSILISQFIFKSSNKITILQSFFSNDKHSLNIDIEESYWKKGIKCIIGCDEVGRGCIAGPVVAAAVCIHSSNDHIYTPIKGIADSKTLTEASRNEIINQIKLQEQQQYISYSISTINNTVIDQINILQSTMLAMHECITDLHTNFLAREQMLHDIHTHSLTPFSTIISLNNNAQTSSSCSSSSSGSSSSSSNNSNHHTTTTNNNNTNNSNASTCSSTNTHTYNYNFYAIIDGNKCPNHLPVPAKPLVQGDSLCYSIAMASIIAKVYRDNLMVCMYTDILCEMSIYMWCLVLVYMYIYICCMFIFSPIMLYL